MASPPQLAAVIEREDYGCVALGPEFDFPHQIDRTVAVARTNLQEALFLQAADPS